MIKYSDAIFCIACMSKLIHKDHKILAHARDMIIGLAQKLKTESENPNIWMDFPKI